MFGDTGSGKAEAGKTQSIGNTFVVHVTVAVFMKGGGGGQVRWVC